MNEDTSNQSTPPRATLSGGSTRATVQPLGRSDEYNNPAVMMIRNKLEKLYASEPNTKEELAESEVAKHPSKHQRKMLEISGAGSSLAEIQTAWHEYYQSLPDHEKHEVWQEFYTEHAKITSNAQTADKVQRLEPVQQIQPEKGQGQKPKVHENESVAVIKERLLHKVEKASSSSNKIRRGAKHHLKSLGFGLSFGGVFIVVMLFSFFNERFITPFITPSKKASASPLLIDPNGSQKVGPEAKVIIPSINVEAPVSYDNNTVAEADIEKTLESGTYHYATTAKPGESGNVIIFGHSSNNIFNKGQYKFVFLSLNKVQVGDQFVLNYGGIRYVYKVFNKRVVEANDVGVLSASPKPNMATLITCDPPGTSLKRLLLEGEQISPSPTVNKASTAIKADTPQVIPSNSPSLWSRITRSIF